MTTNTRSPVTRAEPPDRTADQLAIIIVSWNVKALLRDCLASVLAELAAGQVTGQVWVVDNASSDGSAELVRTEFPTVQLIAASENLGFAGGNNAALRALGFPESQGGQPAAVLLLNPDTIVRPGALATMVDFMVARPRVGIIGAQLSFGDGSFQHGAYGFPGLWQLAIELLPLPGRLYGSRLNGRYTQALYAAGEPFPIEHPLGAAMMVRREAIRAVGLLDEGYHMYVEEIDWSMRMRRAGWAAYCVPAAQVTHLGGQSTGQVRRESFLNLWRSRYRFYRRHYPRWKVFLARQLVRFGMQRKSRADPERRELYRAVQQIWRGQEA